MASGIGISMVLLFIMTSLVLVSRYFTPETYAQSHLKLFIDILAAISVVMVAAQIIISSREAEEHKKFDQLTKTIEAQQTQFLNINEKFANVAADSPDFAATLYSTNPELQKVCQGANADAKKCAVEYKNYTVALEVFQRFENFLSLREFDRSSDREWMSDFVGWAQSAKLKQYWNYSRSYFSRSAAKFIDMLFEYAEKYHPKTQDELLLIGDKMVLDKRLEEATQEVEARQ